jgi:SnoaL-like domain
MSAEATSETMRSYLEALLSRADFAEYFTDDVTWTVVGTDQTMQGREPVRNFLTWMHTQAFDARPKVKTLVVGDGQAILEADFVGTHTGEFVFGLTTAILAALVASATLVPQPQPPRRPPRSRVAHLANQASTNRRIDHYHRRPGTDDRASPLHHSRPRPGSHRQTRHHRPTGPSAGQGRRRDHRDGTLVL